MDLMTPLMDFSPPMKVDLFSPQWIYLPWTHNMNDKLCTLQCLEKIINATYIGDPRKQQKLSAVPMSNVSYNQGYHRFRTKNKDGWGKFEFIT